MKIHSVSLRGFRCFSDTLTTVNLSEGITTLVGTNGSGKTAFLEALARVFGVTREQRTVRKSDFYADPNKSPADVQSAELCIDIRLSFPELVDADCPPDAVAPCFRHMMVAEPGGNPFCRILLEATWSDDGTIDGDIEQKLWWVVSTEETPKEEHPQFLGPRQIERRERGIKMKIERGFGSCLAVREARELFAVSKEKLDLEPRDVVLHELTTIQRQVR